MKVCSVPVPKGNSHCRCNYLEKKKNMISLCDAKKATEYICIYLNYSLKTGVLVYQGWLDEEDARRQGKEERVYPQQSLTAAEPDTHKHTHTHTDI